MISVEKNVAIANLLKTFDSLLIIKLISCSGTNLCGISPADKTTSRTQ